MGLFKSEQERRNKKFMAACEFGDWKKAERLLDEGADLNAKNSAGVSALFLAAYRGQAEIVRQLLEKGADPNTGLTAPFDRDYRYFPRGYTPLMAAGYMGNDNTTAHLLAHGAKADTVDSTGRTALHYAARMGRFPVVKRLVEGGASTNIFDSDGKKPLVLAMEYRHNGIVDFLQEKAPLKKPGAVKEGWTLTAPVEVACVTEKNSLGYRLTDIFNFEARTYTRIASNLETGAESQAVRSFDEFTDKKLIEEAYRNLAKLGGKADKAAIYGRVIGRKPPSPRG